jgi:hypothetical protein
MKRTFLILLTAAFAVLAFTQTGRAQCGVERWSVKTGTDPDANKVSLSSPTTTTIANMTSIATPNTLPDNGRVSPTETTLWFITGTLREYVRAYDSDYHMVVVDSAGRTMIIEIPSPACVGVNSAFASGIAHARAQFDGVFTPTTYFQTANVPVQVTGVGFFDYFEGQQGVAPNGVELHPVIDIKFGPFFALSSSPSSLSIPQGASGNTTITSTLTGVFNSSVALSVSGLPTGATASFSPNTISAPGSGSATLAIGIGSSTAVGTYNVVVTGTGGGQTHTTTINLSVTSATSASQQLLGNTGFENGSAAPSPWVVSNGVIDNSAFEAAHTGSWKAWLNGYGSVHTDTLQQTVSIPSTASQATLSFWLHIDTAETSTTTAYDTLKLQLRNSSGAVLATLATYSNTNAAAGYKHFTFDISSYKGQTVQVYLVGVEDAGLKTSFVVDDFALDVTNSGPPPPPPPSPTPTPTPTASPTPTPTATPTPTPSPSPGGTTQVLGNPGFENGSANPAPWTVSTGVIDNSTFEAAHTGSWKAWLNGYGAPHTDSVLQSVTLPSTATNATLSFWLHIDTAETSKTKAFDTLGVQVRNSSGAVLKTLATYSNLDAATGYSQVTFDLTSYKGQAIQIYLVGMEDQGLKTSFVVDDFLLNVTTQ